jgi:Tfp pilus assembly protein FimT
VVLGIMGVIVGMSAPALTRYAASARLKATTRELVGLLSLSRSLSVGSQQAHLVRVDPEARTVTVTNTVSNEALEQVVRLPKSVAIEVLVGDEPAPAPELTFRPSGALAGRTTVIRLSDESRQQVVTVTGPTGAVTVE